jgi:hypothetical protein
MLLPRQEPVFMSIIDMEPSEVHMIQESTMQPNIQYSVIAYDGEVETLQ